MKATVTVFTPTFNRAGLLPDLYESLKRQTCSDFEWLIIDDGSTDDTKSLVQGWIAEGKVSIRYRYQQNQGMHGAHNTAYACIDTELNVCIDSDDYMVDDAIEKIVSYWNKYGSDQVAGLVGLDAQRDGQIIGTTLPEQIQTATLTDLYGLHGVKGDKKLVYRSALTRLVPPYPLFPNEKYGPLAYKNILIDQICPLLLMNEVLCCVEYRADGSSRNMIQQYKRNPRGFAFYRKTAMLHAPTFRRKLREAMHYVSSSLMVRNYAYLWESPCKWSTLLATPAGIALFFYIQYTNRVAVPTRKGSPLTSGRN